ncbi:MAG: phospholipid transport system transporter-binding protein [Azoarcus sp.]|uniref:Phospholipid transport system transporter-binding protein n=1 Tax=Aromatoleum tolulyticum TaxID=34027 RepID=A0A1N6T3L1_9RHOO|nr:STAS domain-containing protein [Aromatoleum tolulyticum]MCK9986716.1 phospholipid transport system transporter-binding protein [Azoarcus sp.]SIQ47985.1 phospholipid transport system transporter-binding protein [Aromatoleum tolulyticum]
MNADAGKVLAIEGELTMATAAQWIERGRAVARDEDLVVDLSAVSAADSSALALLFDWMRVARASGHKVRQTGMPAGMLSLATLYGVDELLPAEA